MDRKRLAFRFDIDTHKCIRDGVPALLDLARQEEVSYTFFLNCGRSISVLHSLSTVVRRPNCVNEEEVQMMSAIQKLGKRDYIIAATVNPIISNYRGVVREIVQSGSELGLHGGRNHARWGGIHKPGERNR